MFSRGTRGFLPARSIFDSVDELFDDSWMMEDPMGPMHGMLALCPMRQRHHATDRRNHSKPWAATVDLRGYTPEEVTVSKETADDSKSGNTNKLIIRARHESGEDFAELKKCIAIPESVDFSRVSSTMTKESVLIVRAPYKEVKPQEIVRKQSPKHPSLWEELSRMGSGGRDGWIQLAQPELVPSGDGSDAKKWRVKFNVAGMTPADYTLKTEGHSIVLEGRREVTSEHRSQSHSVYESVTVPAGVKLDQLESHLEEDSGVLVVEGPFLSADPLPSGRVIPVRKSGSVGNGTSVPDKMDTDGGK